MLASFLGSVRRGRLAAESLPFRVDDGERWLLVGEGLSELARRILESSEVELVVVSSRMEDFEPLRRFKRSPEQNRLTFLCSSRAEENLFPPHSFDGIATTQSNLYYQRFLRPSGRVVTLSS